jgi:hypothetical protein
MHDVIELLPEAPATTKLAIVQVLQTNTYSAQKLIILHARPLLPFWNFDFTTERYGHATD